MKTNPRLILISVLIGCIHTSTTSAQDQTTIPTLDPRVVFGDPSVPTLELPPIDGLEDLSSTHLGEALSGTPGLAFEKRGHDIVDPQIRGLGFDRVVTLVNGLPVLHNSPTRTAAPINALGPGSVRGVSIVKGLASVSLGAAASGGYIEVNTFKAPGTVDSTTLGGTMTLNYQPDRSGWQSFVEGRYRSPKWEVSGSGYYQDLGNYRAGDGREVSARFKSRGATVGARYHQGIHHFQATGIYQNIIEQENISLPLDTKNSETVNLALRHEITPEGNTLQTLSWAFGYTTADPFLTIEDRPVIPAPITAQADTNAVQFRVDSIWNLPADQQLRTGFLYLKNERNTIRYRGPFQDHIWPDTQYENLGAYVEWHANPNDRLHLRSGMRLDQIDSIARSANETAFGVPIIDLYEIYNGPEARKNENNHTVGAANLMGTYTISNATTLYGGIGYAVQAPAATEQYRAFLQALGVGFEIGNPALDPEKKWETVLGLEHSSDIWLFKIEGYFYAFSDYIHRRQIGVTTTPPPNQPLFGFRNIDATFWGIEGSGIYRLSNSLSFPFSFSYADAENQDTNKGIAEIPPWKLSLGFDHAIEWRSQAFSWGAEARYVASRENPAPEENIIYSDTDSFILVDVKATWQPTDQWTATLRINNLFDQLYYNYLTPPTAPIPPETGDLLPGDPIPGQGIAASLSLSFTF